MVCWLSALQVSLELRKVFLLVLHLPINNLSPFLYKKIVLLRVDFDEDGILGETPRVIVRLRSTETQPLYNREFEQGRRQRKKDAIIIIIIIIDI